MVLVGHRLGWPSARHGALRQRRHAWRSRVGKSDGLDQGELTGALEVAYWSWLAYWAREDYDAYVRSVFKRIAFVTRYSSITLTEALEVETSFLLHFASAIGEIVREENSARPGSSD